MMMMGCSLKMLTAVVVVAVLSVGGLIGQTGAQDPMTCASKLVACQAFLNTTTTPPESCCGPIKEAVKTDLLCLCNLYNDPTVFSSLNINVTQAVQLSRRCGVTTDLSNCKTAAQSPTGEPGGVPGNDGGRIARTGFWSLLLVWVSMLFV